MWKATVGANINSDVTDDGDWETDPDFINNVTEQEQRWGSKTIEGSGRTVGAIDMNKLREETTKAYELQKQKQKEDMSGSYGYGGKFGIEKDRMDKSAVGHDYVAKVEKHVSQTDYSAGFGGKYGVQTDRVDKSAVSWDHKESLQKHASQKDYSSGFGGKFGVEKDRQDKSAVGWDHVEKLQKHDSQNVGKREDIITEQMQKPSQLKAKFESLAKQNEVKQVEKRKPLNTQRKTLFGANLVATNQFQETVKTNSNDNVKTDSNENAKMEYQKMKIEEQIMQEKMKQMEIEEERQQNLIEQQRKVELEKKRQQELLEQQRQQELLAQSQSQLIANQQENTLLTDITTAHPADENEINANILATEEQIYEPIYDECYTAIALYDYQAAADDEISFDPDDIITNIEKIDEGWWRGTCHGQTGLFPANYVQLRE